MLGFIYDERIERVARELEGKRGVVSVFMFDTSSLFNKALDDPTAFEATSGILDATEPCQGYALWVFAFLFWKSFVRCEQCWRGL